MNVRSLPFACVVVLVLGVLPGLYCLAEEAKDKPEVKAAEVQPATAGSAAATPAATATPAAAQPKPKYPAYSELLADSQTIEGMIKLHRKDMKLYGELSPGDLNKDLIVVIAIARGIAEKPLLGGMSWNFGNDWVWQFRKTDDRIQIVRRNVRFRAAKGTPQEKAVHFAYTDSVLFSLPIATVSPSGNDVVDLTPVFMSDLPQIASVLQGFNFAPDRSSWASVKGFKDNVEIQVAATYASAGLKSFDTVPDSRGVTLHIHYSISRLVETGYQPRLADDRVGHFLTVIKDYSKTDGDDQFVRYINRWDLRKAEPAAAVSPPVAPIIFWIEKTVPYQYRAPVRAGILEWNKAFEKAGFVNAIEVRQQPDDATWDPEDINYNTFRWITSSAGLAIGPSRVNPTTGQILDADILFDADFIRHWREVYEINIPEVGEPSVGPLGIEHGLEGLEGVPPYLRHNHSMLCDCPRGMAQQLAFGAMALAEGGKPIPKEQLDQLIMDGVKAITIHEVGHTLGLRHNFIASAWLSMDELNDPEKTRTTGLAASVMDYLPVNISPKGKKQGDFFSTVVGPYDYWAIEYAYKPFPGGTQGEVAELKKIASRGTEPALNYATDEDAGLFDPDPLVNRFDLGKDPIEFARRRVELINQILPGLVDQIVEPGEGYQRARRAFDSLLNEHARAMTFVARFIGGVYVHRDHRGDPNARPPLVVVEPAKQREALDFLEQQVFGPEAYQFPTKLYDYLAPTFWHHWGMEGMTRPDFPVHETILHAQEMVLVQLLSSSTLERLIDSEMKVPAEEEVFTAAELLRRLTASVFRETEKLQEGKFTDRRPAISSLRRNLQQAYFERLSELAMGNLVAPTDCQAVAYAELEALEGRVKQVLAGKAELDTYTRSHLSDLAVRIRKVLDARLQLKHP
jgi:hypothetical protein